MSDATENLRRAAVARVLGAVGEATQADRQAAFDNSAAVPAAGRALVAKVVATAWKVTDEDVEGALKTGLTEDQVFEIVVATAMGQATRQLAAARAAIAAADKVKS